jgi:hypothetical protein
MEPLTPGMALRLIDYLQSHPERSVFWRSDTRVWIFADDDPDGGVTEVPERELGAYLSEHSGRADSINAIFAAEVAAAWRRYTDSGREHDRTLMDDIEAALSDREEALDAEADI